MLATSQVYRANSYSCTAVDMYYIHNLQLDYQDNVAIYPAVHQLLLYTKSTVIICIYVAASSSHIFSTQCNCSQICFSFTFKQRMMMCMCMRTYGCQMMMTSNQQNNQFYYMF